MAVYSSLSARLARKLVIAVAAAFLIGVAAGWASKFLFDARPMTGRFHVDGFGGFSFSYPMRKDAVWSGVDDGYSYVSGIPVNEEGLPVTGRPFVPPALTVFLHSTTTGVTVDQYIQEIYPKVHAGYIGTYQTSATPFARGPFSGDLVTYQNEGLGGFEGRVFVFTADRQCQPKGNPDCGNLIYVVDDKAGLFTADEFKGILNSLRDAAP